MAQDWRGLGAVLARAVVSSCSLVAASVRRWCGAGVGLARVSARFALGWLATACARLARGWRELA